MAPFIRSVCEVRLQRKAYALPRYLVKFFSEEKSKM